MFTKHWSRKSARGPPGVVKGPSRVTTSEPAIPMTMACQTMAQQQVTYLDFSVCVPGQLHVTLVLVLHISALVPFPSTLLRTSGRKPV